MMGEREDKDWPPAEGSEVGLLGGVAFAGSRFFSYRTAETLNYGSTALSVSGTLPPLVADLRGRWATAGQGGCLRILRHSRGESGLVNVLFKKK